MDNVNKNKRIEEYDIGERYPENYQKVYEDDKVRLEKKISELLRESEKLKAELKSKPETPSSELILSVVEEEGLSDVLDRSIYVNYINAAEKYLNEAACVADCVEEFEKQTNTINQTCLQLSEKLNRFALNEIMK